MQISAKDLSNLLQGEIVGNENVVLHTIAKIEEGKEGALSFLSNLKYEPHLYTTKSSVVLVNKSFTPTAKVNATLIRVEDAYRAFTFILEKFSAVANKKSGIAQSAVIETEIKIPESTYIGAQTYIAVDVEIGENCQIYPQVYLGDGVRVGNNVTLFPGVKVYANCVIGNNCIIHAGTVIGSDGFGFAPLPDRSYKKIPQLGNVIIEDDVEIGSNCSIDKATMGSTIIRKGVKMDNLVQIAHNVEIGEHTVIAGQSGIAGSTKIGRYCVFGGQVGIAGHIVIADGNQFGAQSGVSSSIQEENGKWFGSPVIEVRQALKSGVVYRKLPDLEKKLNELDKIVKEKK